MMDALRQSRKFSAFSGNGFLISFSLVSLSTSSSKHLRMRACSSILLDVQGYQCLALDFGLVPHTLLFRILPYCQDAMHNNIAKGFQTVLNVVI